MTTHPTDYQRFLVIPKKQIGDTILMVPTLRNLRQNYPNATIDVITSPESHKILAPCPYIDNVLVALDKDPAGFFKQLRQGNYDAALLYRHGIKYPFFCKLAGIKTTIGYQTQTLLNQLPQQSWGLFIDHPVESYDHPEMAHYVDRYLNFLTPLGVPIHNRHLELWPGEEAHNTLETLFESEGIPQGKPIAIVHPLIANTRKYVPLECFEDTLQLLAAHGITIITTGLKQDHAPLEALKDKTKVPFHNIAGKTPIPVLIALTGKASILVSIDSSPIHMAAAMNTPQIIGIYRDCYPPEEWGAYNTHCQFQPVVYTDTTRNKQALSQALERAVHQAIAPPTPA